jgi:NitT/TauT family transport system substrate-binding protein
MGERLHRIAIVTALAGVTLWAAGSAGAGEPLNIRHGWVVMTGDMSPMVFEKRDLMQHYGKTYTVSPVHFAGTSLQITALASGELDIASLAYSSLAIAVENAGLNDLRVIADGFQDGVKDYGSIQYMVRNDSGLKKVDDLKGKILGINVIGAAVDIGARAVLADHGLVANRDYSIIEAPFPAIGTMLLQGKADIVSEVPPFLYAPNVQQGAHTLFTMKDGMGSSQMIVLVAREGFLKAHRAALDDFFSDMVRGIHWMLDPKNREAAITFAAGVANQPRSLLTPFYLTRKDQYRDPDGVPDLAALQRNIDTQVRLGFLKSSIDVAKYADLSFVKRAARKNHMASLQ